MTFFTVPLRKEKIINPLLRVPYLPRVSHHSTVVVRLGYTGIYVPGPGIRSVLLPVPRDICSVSSLKHVDLDSAFGRRSRRGPLFVSGLSSYLHFSECMTFF